jgi:hypothetical protein
MRVPGRAGRVATTNTTRHSLKWTTRENGPTTLFELAAATVRGQGVCEGKK